MTIDKIIILGEIKVGLEKDVPYETLEGMTVVIVDHHQDQGPGPGQIQESVQTETELGVINVGNTTRLLAIALTLSWMKNQTSTIQIINQCYKFWHMIHITIL